ncbi:MAG: hypothetical protein IJ353_02115 [Lachnospiraceae bacterium]|nr:hypothetical protein [Lachnospiraceae bacterium]
METKDNVTTYRSHRVGSVTAGLTMVGYGVMFFLRLFLDMVDYQTMFSLWPVMLILLGLELLISNFSTKKIVYDKAAIFLLIVMTFFAMGMAVADLCFKWAELQMWRYY